MMALQILILFAGLLLIVFGSDWLVDGASSIARKAGVSEFVIGLTIVGFGTSCPELVVSLNGAFRGIADIAVGNVIGSNIFNVLLILGLTAVILPIPITEANKKRDIPIMVLVTFLLIFFGMSKTLLGIGGCDQLSRVEGFVLLILFVFYMYVCFRYDDGSSEDTDNHKTKSLAAAVALTLLGLAGLVFGGKLFVDSAVEIAGNLGLSEKFIAITILAGGTSLPELATSVTAALKKRGQLALGNILGSCVFNILLILGCSSLITPLSFAGINVVDAVALLFSSVTVWLSSYSFKKDRLDRYEGAIMLAFFVAYYVWLFMKG